MQEKSLIKKNILQYIDYKGISKYQFYQSTGITRGILDQNNGMSEENTAKFLAYATDVNIEWLITGKGNMLIDDKDNTAPPLENKEFQEMEPEPPPENENIMSRFGQLIELNLELAKQNKKLLDLLESNLQKHNVAGAGGAAKKVATG